MERLKTIFNQKLPNWDLVFFSILFFYFTLRLIFFATSIAPGISPDEKEHIDLIVLYSQSNSFILEESPQTTHLDLVTRRPHLYFWIMGRLLHGNVFGMPDFLFLRIIHVFLSLLTLLISFRLFRLLSKDKMISALGVSVLTNIPMFSFLSAFVSYDNLINLLSVLSFYFLFKYLLKNNISYLYGLILASLLGTLIKVTFLPLLVILILIFFVDRIKSRRQRLNMKTHLTLISPIKTTLFFSFLALLIYLNGSFYIANLYRYKKILPDCDQILTLEECLQKKNFQIEYLLRERARQIPRERFLKLHDYFFPWMIVMQRTILGIFGHRVILKTSTELIFYNMLLALFLIFFIRYFHWKDRFVNYCILSVLIYGWILFYYVGYRMFYLNAGYVEAHLQGRYLFPVLFPLVFLFSYYMLSFRKWPLKILLFLFIALIFILGDLPYFLKNADKSWYIQGHQRLKINKIAYCG